MRPAPIILIVFDFAVLLDVLQQRRITIGEQYAELGGDPFQFVGLLLAEAVRPHDLVSGPEPQLGQVRDAEPPERKSIDAR